MVDQAFRPLMFTVQSDDPEVMESFRSIDSDDLRAGQIEKKRYIEDARFHPAGVVHIAYQVIGVLGSIGGAARFVDWVVEKAKLMGPSVPPLRIEIGTAKIEISGSQNLDEIRRTLYDALQMPRPS